MKPTLGQLMFSTILEFTTGLIVLQYETYEKMWNELSIERKLEIEKMCGPFLEELKKDEQSLFYERLISAMDVFDGLDNALARTEQFIKEYENEV